MLNDREAEVSAAPTLNAGAERLLEAISCTCDGEATFVARLQAALASVKGCLGGVSRDGEIVAAVTRSPAGF